MNNPKKEPLSESAAYRRAIQLIAAGLFLQGSVGEESIISRCKISKFRFETIAQALPLTLEFFRCR